MNDCLDLDQRDRPFHSFNIGDRPSILIALSDRDHWHNSYPALMEGNAFV